MYLCIYIYTTATDDFKSESFLIYKVFELSTESIPQIFLQLVILAKIWEKWDVNLQTLDSNNSDQSFCSNQAVFFLSLGVSILQVGITLQDLMERDVPYGVFPNLIPAGMTQSNMLQSVLLQVLTCLYYAISILARLSSWVPFCIVCSLSFFVFTQPFL